MNQFCTNCGSRITSNKRFCVRCGIKVKRKSRLRKWFIGFLLILGFFFIGIIFGEEEIDTVGTDDINKLNAIEEVMIDSFDKDLDYTNTTSAAVVNVLCPYKGSRISFDSEGKGGSGVVIQNDGIVITNSHIIPQIGDELDVNEEGCIVLFHNTKNGLPMQAYLAEPVILPEYSEQYDLALLFIKDVYRDRFGNAYGKFPNKFPAISSDNCSQEEIKLGESITVYGYPDITGGYSLTVTEGVISSFSPEGIVISAKIDSGNSGGLTVDKDGCFVGIPTMVNYGDAESYGIIIPPDDVDTFLNIYLLTVEEDV